MKTRIVFQVQRNKHLHLPNRLPPAHHKAPPKQPFTSPHPWAPPSLPSYLVAIPRPLSRPPATHLHNLQLRAQRNLKLLLQEPQHHQAHPHMNPPRPRVHTTLPALCHVPGQPLEYDPNLQDRHRSSRLVKVPTASVFLDQRSSQVRFYFTAVFDRLQGVPIS